VADLIAQGVEPEQRWRRALRVGERLVLGRETPPWSAPWDERISRRHAELTFRGGRLEIRQLESARNPIFFKGQESREFQLKPGEHFVIGETTFTLSEDRLDISLSASPPLEEQTFSSQYLRRMRFHDADHRIEVLSRLPDMISGAATESDLFVRLVNMLLAGIPRASAVALVVADSAAEAHARVQVLHWDRRLAIGGDFQPSQRLIVEAIRRQQSVVHVLDRSVHGTSRDSANQEFTVRENVDWAFCTPVLGEACPGWGVYVVGRFAPDLPRTPEAIGPTDLREDLKFTELVAATLASLRQVQLLERKHASLSQFFAPAVLDAIGSADPGVVLAPRETEVSVLFCDLRGFALESERNADDLLGLLKRVSKALGVMTHHILDQGGVVGDFQGDAAMGFWGWPFPQEDAIQRAALAALAIRSEFEAAARRPGHPLADFRMGIGLATGRAVAGRIGTSDQVKVTVFGPVVNRASRLEGMTKILRASILIDANTARFVKTGLPSHLARCRRLAVVQPYGVDSSLEISELLPPVSEYEELEDTHIAFYEQALDAFLAGRWSESLELLHQVPAKDRVKDFLTVFIAQNNRTPPANWDGVIPMTSKG
jgi:adenylate cyclase